MSTFATAPPPLGQRSQQTRAPTLVRSAGWLFALVLLAGALVACDDEEPQAVALVLGNHEGAALVFGADGQPGAVVTEQLEELSARPGKVSLVRLDGLPEMVDTVQLEVDRTSSVTINDSVVYNQRLLTEAAQQTRAVVDQTDPLTALGIAADAVRGKPSPRIIVIDNGLSTTGALLMQTGLISRHLDAPQIARELREVGMAPDLTGIPVTWLGLCSVQPPQLACPPYAKSALRDLWEAIVGHEVTFEDTPLPPLPGISLPTVDPVPFQVGAIGSSETTPSPPGPVIPPLTEDRVRFKTSSNEFIDVEQARKVLRPIAKLLQRSTYPSATITGCTARDPSSSLPRMKARGLGRAQAVKRELVSMGATSRLKTASPGWKCPGHVNEVVGNQWVDTIAAKNRKIIIKAEVS